MTETSESRLCLWCRRTLPDLTDLAGDAEVACRCGITYHVSFVRDTDEDVWQGILDRRNLSVRRDGDVLHVEWRSA